MECEDLANVSALSLRGYSTKGLTQGFWCGEYGFSALGVDAILGNGCGTQGQNIVGMTPGK